MAPVKVLFVHYGDDWIRGSETVLLDLLRSLDRKAVTPIVWCNGQKLADACREEGYPTHCTPFAIYFDSGAPAFHLNKYLALVREGRALVQRYAPHVLHANSAAPTQWMVPVARSERLPLLTHLHIRYLRRSRYSLLLHQADSLVGVCEDAAAGLRSDGMDKKRVKVIYNGIDVERIDKAPTRDLRQALDIPPEAVVIGAVGSLIKRKGHDLLIEALAMLVARGKTASKLAPHLVIAGDGPEGGRLEALAVAHGLDRLVHFAGYCNPVVDLYHAVDLVALATRADALPLTLVEAGLCGKPVVATRVGGIPEVVIDGKTGMIVGPEDVGAMSNALDQLTADPSLRAEMGKAARQRVLTSFSADGMARSFEKEYLRLAALGDGSLGWRTTISRLAPYKKLLIGRDKGLRETLIN